MHGQHATHVLSPAGCGLRSRVTVLNSVVRGPKPGGCSFHPPAPKHCGRRRAKGGWLVKSKHIFLFPPSGLTIARKTSENSAIDRASEARSIAEFSEVKPDRLPSFPKFCAQWLTRRCVSLKFWLNVFGSMNHPVRGPRARVHGEFGSQLVGIYNVWVS